MKLASIIVLFTAIISTVLSKKHEITAYNYEATFYGCPEECHTQRNPACDQDMDVGKYFCALSNLFDYKKYCKQYAIVMLTNGSRNMVKARVVDSCGSCDKLHVDLSKPAFTELTSEGKGVSNIIWAVYSREGKKLTGPYYNRANRAAEEFGISSSRFLSAFEANAKELARSSSHTRKFNPNLGIVPKRTTTAIKTVVAPSSKQVSATKVVGPSTVPNTKAPAKQVTEKIVSHAVNEVDDGKGPTVGMIVGVGSSIGCAAGLGILFIKKRNPNQYENLKQKFPEAFTQVKRGLSRSATQLTRGASELKRKVTRRAPKTNVDNGAVEISSPIPTPTEN